MNQYGNFYGPYTPPPPQYPPPNLPIGYSVAGFVLGLISVLSACTMCLSLICAIIGLALSATGIQKADLGQGGGRGMAVAGLVLSIIGIGLSLFWIICMAVFESAMEDIFWIRAIDNMF